MDILKAQDILDIMVNDPETAVDMVEDPKYWQGRIRI
jgi:hypothetical protein